MDKLIEVFKEEAYELLAELETSLLELEEKPDDMESIGRVFRAMHTIKGSGAMCGFDAIASFTHEMETVFDMVRHGKMHVTKQLVDLTLAARDQIKVMLDRVEEDELADNSKAAEIVAALRKIMEADTSINPEREQPAEIKNPAIPESSRLPKEITSETFVESNQTPSDSTSESFTYRIRFHPKLDIFSNGTNPLLLLHELQQLGECLIVANTDAIPQLKDINPEFCYLYWDIVLTTDKGENAIKDVFIFIQDDCELKIDVIDQKNTLENEENYKKIGEILLERGDVTTKDLEKVLTMQKRLGEILVETKMVAPRKVESALLEQEHIKEIREKRQSAELSSTIKVPSERLDSLVNLVGELVTVQARLSQTSVYKNDPDLLSIAEEVERLTGELRDKTMSIRMLPIGSTFSKFNRLVRDLSRGLGKEIELKADGAETELDKTVIEKLTDPMVHLIRNSIDHGIELPEIRKASGKSRRGSICLSARHSGANVVIEVKDDGAGLKGEGIRKKAVEMGLITPEAKLSEKELFALILAPGFSTAKNITNVSGRGVGMDVVKRAIDSLRGTIEIDSQQGVGTIIALKLPLTLAIIDGLLVKIAEEHYVMPLVMVEECVELNRDDIKKAHGRNIANVRGQITPYISLRELFQIEGPSPDLEQIVIADFGGSKVGFVVDNVIGEHQTVLKSLGGFYKQVEGVSGATILGDGTVALILDIPKLVKHAELLEKMLV